MFRWAAPPLPAWSEAPPVTSPAERFRFRLLVVASIAASLMFMVPRLLDARFGLLDDGVILYMAGRIVEEPLLALRVGAAQGRLVPGFWLFNTVIYMVAGQSAPGFYVANAAILAALIIGIMLLVRSAGGSLSESALAGGLLLLSGATVEAFYTLSKAEPLQTLCLVWSMYFAVRSGASRLGSAAWAAHALASGLLLLTATAAKETTVVVFPVAVAWSVTAAMSGRWRSSPERATLLVLLGAAAGCVAAFLVARAAVMPVASVGGSYASNFQVSADRLLASGERVGRWVLHDYAHTILLAIIVLPLLGRASSVQKRLLTASAIWIAGWIAIYLPWHSLLQYYLLPFAVGASVFSAVALSLLVESARRSNGPALTRALSGVALVLSGGVLVCNLVNNVTQARIQLLQDRANAHLVDFLSTLPVGAHVLVNVTEPNEYEYEIGLHLSELKQRSDITVNFLRPDPPERPSNGRHYVATPVCENQPDPAVRMAIWEADARARNRELDLLTGGAPDLWAFTDRMPIVDVGFHLLPSIVLRTRGHTPADGEVWRPFLDVRTLVYGWRVTAFHQPR